MHGQPADQQSEAEREPTGRLRGEHRLFFGQRRAGSIPLQSRLLVRGETEDVIDDSAGGQFGIGFGDAGIAGRSRQPPDEIGHRPGLPGGETRRYQFGAVGVGQQRVAQGTAGVRDPVLPVAGGIAERLENPVGHRPQQLLLVGEMPVQGARTDAEFARQPAHGQIGDPEVVQDRRGGVDEVTFVQLHGGSLT
ncbi:MAG: hypothetical protein K0R33_1351 [Mycobacterium sp.]|nr:hypothetical protein [Mycobacterium sp.]